ncbi:conserved protein of unknown function [Tepidanaerobacter acetatoxydans Re1]|uniref:BioF2-like acetyltransferase domain-containing protein n=1 Tax=Tepidanaerobacter acetatoxydans (strain DSM 21804 / JCM 16047 / Re1) TaxID=1209989 RepID=F4LX98_TEPAE|nr:peptidoglycan bridge formation glycyltransferase FemA/FemB family protein [Tepidanaerobacter acetatoxydans]AEE91897.1 hypothetical protein TepRe1_1766 [Tepidanaerobacter acetatoxydans Re1]CCP26718.1 conserved protein of unknown function [Tepidanaerobacter acetatoxydans Re1]
MINVTYKKKYFKINAVWFCKDIEVIVDRSRGDFIFLHGIDKSVLDTNRKNAIINKQFSLITDLKAEPEEIFKEFNKNYRYEINRAGKEGVNCISYLSEDLKDDPDILASFKMEYTNFVKLKGIVNSYNEPAMQQYIANGNVLLTKALKDKQSYAQHVYLYDNRIARLLYSVSNFRTKDLDPNFAGRANKYLHWHDIQYLHKHKIEVLDWGGISSIENLNGIDKFKKGFGGKEHTYYNIIFGKSLIGKLAISMMKLKRS